jgi:hypothetical protein
MILITEIASESVGFFNEIVGRHIGIQFELRCIHVCLSVCLCVAKHTYCMYRAMFGYITGFYREHHRVFHGFVEIVFRQILQQRVLGVGKVGCHIQKCRVLIRCVLAGKVVADLASDVRHDTRIRESLDQNLFRQDVRVTRTNADSFAPLRCLFQGKTESGVEMLGAHRRSERQDEDQNYPAQSNRNKDSYELCIFFFDDDTFVLLLKSKAPSPMDRPVITKRETRITYFPRFSY